MRKRILITPVAVALLALPALAEPVPDSRAAERAPFWQSPPAETAPAAAPAAEPQVPEAAAPADEVQEVRTESDEAPIATEATGTVEGSASGDIGQVELYYPGGE